MTTEMMVWQGLMDQAYAKWQADGKKWSYRQFLANLDAVERKAVILGNFNYQVCNGGLQQWVDNGYATATARELLDILEEINTENSRRVIKILQSLAPHVDMTCTENRGFGHNYWTHDEDGDREYGPPAWLEEIDALTDEYYEFYEQFTPEVEGYLAKLTA